MMPPDPFSPPDAGTAMERGSAAFARAQLVILTKRADFLRAASARRQAMPGFLLQARARTAAEPIDPAHSRVGFTCSKKLGNAVARNRAKRRLREIARLVLTDQARPGWDYVLVGRPVVTATRDFAALMGELSRAIALVHGEQAKGGSA